MEGSTVLRSGRQLKLNYGPSLERLAAGDRVRVKRTAEGAMKILINGDYAGVACSGVAAAARAMVSLAGGMMGVSVTSSHKVTSPGPGQEKSQASHLADSLHSTVLEKEAGAGQQPGDTMAATVFEFHDNTGRNVALCHGNTVARRHDSYNQGLVMSARPLPRNTLFQVPGMKPGWVRRTLLTGQLLTTGEVGLEQRRQGGAVQGGRQ